MLFRFTHIQSIEVFKLDQIYDLEVIEFMYQINLLLWRRSVQPWLDKVQCLPNDLANYFHSVATIHSYNTRQPANNKYIINSDKTKKESLQNL